MSRGILLMAVLAAGLPAPLSLRASAAEESAAESSAPAEKTPEGDSGIASKYPGDAGIARDPDIVLVENFEGRTLADLKKSWNTVGNRADALSVVDLAPPGSPGGKSLKVTIRRGRKAVGYLYKILDDGYDELYARLYVRFAEDYGFNHHFCSLGGELAPKPWPMGRAGLLARKRFGTGFEPTTSIMHTWPPKKMAPPGFWFFYTYYPEMHSWQTVEGKSNGRPNAYYGNNFTPAEPTAVVRGKWICMEWSVKLNSAPDKRDGAQRFWIDGKLLGNWAPGTPKGYWVRENFRIRPDQPEKQKPFEGFKWRTDMRIRINKFKIENYVSDRSFAASEKYKKAHPDFKINDLEATVWFDHVVVAKKYIGPMKTAKKE